MQRDLYISWGIERLRKKHSLLARGEYRYARQSSANQTVAYDTQAV